MVAPGDFGLCQWFHHDDDARLAQAVHLLRDLGVRQLRTGISWADLHRPGGRDWYDRMFAALAGVEGLSLLVSLWHTPPSISANGRTNGPPMRDGRVDPSLFSEAIWEVCDRWGRHFDEIELWNEPNNRLKWDFVEADPGWHLFDDMLAHGAGAARLAGKRTVLGGVALGSPSWIADRRTAGALEEVDVLAIHAFPGLWSPLHPRHNWEWLSEWRGWPAKIAAIRNLADGRPVYVTEAGFATWDPEAGRPTAARERAQASRLAEAAAAPADRLYWYSLLDLDPKRPSLPQSFGEENESEHHCGLVRADGTAKPALGVLRLALPVSAGP